MDNKGYDTSLEIDTKTPELNQHQGTTELKIESQPLKHTFEEAVNLLGSGKFHYLLLLICGMAVLSFISETLGISISMVSAKCDLNFTIYEQGMLASATFLGVVLSSHTIGLLADTCGRKKTLKYSVMLATITSGVSVFSTTIWMLIILRFLVGIFMNGCQSCVFSYMSEFHGNKTKSKYVTFLTIFFALGGVYFPAIGMIILPQEYNIYIGTIKFSSWRVMLIICSLPTFVASIALSFLPESPKFLLVQGKHNEALEILSKVYKWNTGKEESMYPVSLVVSNEDSSNDLSKVKSFTEALNVIWMQTKPLFDKQRRWITIILSIHQFVIFFVCHGSFMWIPEMFKPLVQYSDLNWTLCELVQLYNSELKLTNNSNDTIESVCSSSKRVNIFVLQMLLILGIAFGVLYLIFAFIIDIIGKQRLLLIWMLICGPAIICLIWTKGFLLNLILLFFYMVFGNSAGLVTSITVSYYPTNISGMAMCLVMMVGRLGSFVGSNVIGIILNQNCVYLFVMLSSMVCLLIILWNFLPKEKKR